jgi:protein phosphatase
MILLGKTDVGRVRATNQDNYTFYELDKRCHFAVVCDGMGGHNGGNVASELAVKTIKETLISGYDSSIRMRSVENLLIHTIKHANDTIFSASLKDLSLKGMGTTVVLVFVLDDNIYVAHVGDSRAYLYNKKGLKRLTTDHSIVQEMIDRGEITEEESYTHPYKHVITRVLGVASDVQVDCMSFISDAGDIVLICSDGLTNLISENEIEEIFKNEFSEDLCDKLISTANERGGYDNITVVLVNCN